jgi:hypothetical protein
VSPTTCTGKAALVLPLGIRTLVLRLTKSVAFLAVPSTVAAVTVTSFAAACDSLTTRLACFCPESPSLRDTSPMLREGTTDGVSEYPITMGPWSGVTGDPSGPRLRFPSMAMW